jgi:hypothetical protein
MLKTVTKVELQGPFHSCWHNFLGDRALKVITNSAVTGSEGRKVLRSKLGGIWPRCRPLVARLRDDLRFTHEPQFILSYYESLKRPSAAANYQDISLALYSLCFITQGHATIMDMMAAEEARVSVDVQREDKIPMINVDGGLEAISDPENKFQKAIAVWRGSSTSIFWLRRQRPNALAGINLSTLLSKLDATASEVVAHQRDSLVQRKDLAQKTKDFRKLDDAGKLGEYKGLLKGTDGPVRIFGLD